MKLVVVESPLRGKDWSDMEENQRFVRLCMRDCLINRNEAPYASHALYPHPDILNDKVQPERKLGMQAGFEWKKVGDLTAIYINRLISGGMHDGIRISLDLKQEFEYRVLEGYPNSFPRPTICTLTAAPGVDKADVFKKLMEARSDLPYFAEFAPEGVEALRAKMAAENENYEDSIVSFYLLSSGEEGKEWDIAARHSKIPYIFIQNNGSAAGIDRAVQQMSLFF